MAKINISYAVSFGKCDGGDGKLEINVLEDDYKWISVVKKLTEEIDTDEINEAIHEIKNEVKRIKKLNSNEKYETQLCLIDDEEEITKDELLSVDWNSVDVDKFVDEVRDEIYEYEKECYDDLYDENNDDYDEDDNDECDDDYPGVITGIYW